MKVFEAFFDDFNVVTINLLNADYKNAKKTFKIYDVDNNKYIDTIETRKESDDFYTYITLSFNYDINVGHKYYVIDEYRFMSLIKYRLICQTKRFDELYFYNGALGVKYDLDYSIFRLWAPTAYKVILRIDNEYLLMNREDNGVFSLKVNKNLLNKKYTYLVDVNGSINEVCDPYSILSGPNATYSIVSDIEELTSLHNVMRHDSIYELSVRDYSKDHNFNSLKERIPYIKNLNVSTVQIMPIFDFGSVDELNPDLYYNWGYDPVQYFAFEGSYSKNPLNDFKELVKEFHNNNLNVTLDAVFNHVFDSDTFTLNLIVPYYFFRYKNYPDLNLTKFSGCQNDFRSEAKMSYKFYKDVLSYLIKYFDIDGIRFDLMGLLDLNTIKRLEKHLKTIKPSIILYGEGWDMNPYINGATLKNASSLPSVAFFNDYFRDNVIDLLKGDYSKWYYVIDTMKGNHAKDFLSPKQSINYIECHDGYTFYDNVKRCVRGKNAKNICDLGLAMVTFAQGIPFFHQGQETYHSKNGNSNSYNLGDKINHINEFNNDNLLSKLMKIRQNAADCFFNSYEEVSKYVKIEMMNDVIYYSSKYLLVVFNYSSNEIELNNNYELLLRTGNEKDKLEPYCFACYKTY